MPGIDKSGPVPLYYQLKQLIREKINSGDWRPGQLIPSERELCAEHGISRMTVRQALVDLVNEGCLRREQGKGTYVSQPKIEQGLGALTSFTQDMAARGKRVESQVLRQEMVLAESDVAAWLGLEPGQAVVLLERLRLANGEPLALETCHLWFPGCERLLKEDLVHNSLYAILSSKYGLVANKASQQIEAAICAPRPMQLLGLRRGAAVLLTHRTTYTHAGAPFEHTVSVYRGDKYVFQAMLAHD